MGLLDDILGQLGGGGGGMQQPQRRPQPQAAPATGGMDMSRILMALLPVVLSMLAQRGQRGGGGGGLSLPGGLGGSAGGGGGLGDILGGLLTGGARAGGGGSGMGGLGGLLEQLGRAGLGRQAQSWVSTGANEGISAADVESLFGADGLDEIAQRAGLTQQETAMGLSQLLPEVIDHVTPAGEVPAESDLLGSVDALVRRMGG
jgi:uncharacterized protein YidB (DUF937 family)